MEIKVVSQGKMAARAEVARGCFSRLFLQDDLGAARELFARVREWQAAQGESACVGPVSPTPTRLLEGVRTAGFARKDRLSPVQPPHYAR